MLSALDILYIVLAIGIALFSIFFSIVLVYAILILRDVNKATELVKDSAERVNKMIIAPLKMTGEVVKLARPVVEAASRKVHERMSHHSDEDETEKPKKKKGRRKK